ncbi:MAG TPA: hypothetical protein VK536_05150 [Candidatus Limnocylindrales bacterium]|nr:hypothetical protein [Candidatus Limnocylindrales bacterium]
MYGNRGQMRHRLQEIIQRFREKGATSPEKAMTIQELGLPPQFEQAMHRRLGQTGIFVEVNSKYYLNEDRLKQIQDERGRRGAAGGGGMTGEPPPTWFRYAGILLMLPAGVIAVALLVLYFYFYPGAISYPGELLLIVLVVVVIMFVARLLFWRSRRNYWRQRWTQNNPPYGQ